MINSKQRGFTLVELMIATSVFAVVMLIGLYTFINISRTYTKGISIIRTQDVIRNLEAEISNNLQFSNAKPIKVGLDNGYYANCVGDRAYVYKFNEVENGKGSALTVYSLPSSADCADYDVNSAEVLLKKGTRVLEFDVSQSGALPRLYSIKISLLYEPDQTDVKPQMVDTTSNSYADWTCKTGIKGSEYCALTKLSTVVYKRFSPQ